MTRRIGNVIHIEPEPPGQCEDCGKTAELRPYGPGETNICMECGMKDPEGTNRRMHQYLYGPRDEA